LGFTALVSISLLGFLLGLVIDSTWIGLLGILPILIGLRNLINLRKDNAADNKADNKTVNLKNNAKFHGFDSRKRSLRDVIRDRQTYSVSAVTISNGGNNLGIHIPLFASS
jgi:cadmium resistance protein CadD (predicted permease)